MENRDIDYTKTCGSSDGHMCINCSSMLIDSQTGNMYWKCNRYNERLYDNQHNWLERCKECLENGQPAHW